MCVCSVWFYKAACYVNPSKTKKEIQVIVKKNICEKNYNCQ